MKSASVHVASPDWLDPSPGDIKRTHTTADEHPMVSFVPLTCLPTPRDEGGMGCHGDGRWRGRDDQTAETEGEEVDCEVTPGGMLVQRRNGEGVPPPPRVVVRVSYGAARMAVNVSSRATFGELKKLLTVETGLQPGDQILMYKGKERENTDYLDLCGVKNKSKVTLVEDPCSVERRYIEMKNNAWIQNIQRAISDVTMEIDKLADQVTAIEESISGGSKVADVQITALTELLMRQAVRLDGIPAKGDTIFQKTMQAKRVQKCVETLDALTVSNERLNSVVVTTKWETFDSPATTNRDFLI